MNSQICIWKQDSLGIGLRSSSFWRYSLCGILEFLLRFTEHSARFDVSNRLINLESTIGRCSSRNWRYRSVCTPDQCLSQFLLPFAVSVLEVCINRRD